MMLCPTTPTGVLAVLAVLMALGAQRTTAVVTIDKSVYRDLVVEIRDNVPVAECASILINLETALTAASQFLFSALDGRAHFGNVIVVLPTEWPNHCAPQNRSVASSRGERPDVTLTRAHPVHREAVWTQQAGGCGEAGEQVYGAFGALARPTIGRELVREWAKYRYGVFDELGFANDPIYPQCYRGEKWQPTGCSDAPIHSNGLCTATSQHQHQHNASATADPTARSSIMFAATAANVAMFCDAGTHNRYAPTRHNHMCQRRSTLDVILNHADFQPGNLAPHAPATIVDTRPTFAYKKRQLTRYVLIIDETRDTLVRESWSFLRMAIRKWLVYDLPANTEVGIILANDTASAKTFNITALDVQRNRDYIASFVPFSPGDAQRAACIDCAVRDALEMLAQREHSDGPASQVVVVVAPGMDFNTDVQGLGERARTAGVRLATINYPGVARRQPLDALAAEVPGGVAHTVYEQKQNGEKSYLTTYFELSNVFYHILGEFFEGNRLQLPIEIHRKELVDVSDDSGTSAAKRISRQITAAFVLDAALGSPSSFYIYTHNAENPLIQSAKLTSPSGVQTSIRSDQRLPVKQLAISAVIGETGTWTYTIDRYNGDPQPHFVQVMATAKSTAGPVVQARAWWRQPLAHAPNGPLVLYVEVRKGELPVSAAAVEVTVTRPDVVCNGTAGVCREKFRLFDTGSGDPDVQRGDGIYSRYFNVAAMGGRGAYKFEIVVTDNGNTAYALAESYAAGAEAADDGSVVCCGSAVPVPAKQPLTPFQRVLPSITIFAGDELVAGNRPANVADLGQIGDLRSELVDGGRVRLQWTSPDMGGLKVARYEVKYALSAADIIDNFETAALRWEHEQPFAFSVGDDSGLTMNVSAEPALSGRWVFVAVRPYSELTMDARAGPVSNVASVFVPRPPAPSTQRPLHAVDSGFFSFGVDGAGADGTEVVNADGTLAGETASKASLYDLNWELLIPVIAGIFLVAIVIIAFCYFCLLRRQQKTVVDFPKKMMHTTKKVENVTAGAVTVSAGSPLHSMPHHMATPEHGSMSHQQHQQQQQQQHQHSQQNSHYGHVQQQQHLPAYHAAELDVPDHHTVGLPIYSSEEEIHKKRYSIVNEQEHQLIQKMKHQHIQRVFRPANNQQQQSCGISVISASNNNTLQGGGGSGRMFGGGGGPYDSWTASQLLQDDGQSGDMRRNSPYDELANQSVMSAEQMHMLGQQQMMQQQQQQPDQYSMMSGSVHQQQQQHMQHMQQQQQQLIDHLSMSGGGGAPPVPPLPYGAVPEAAYPASLYGTGPVHHIMDQPPAYMTSINQAGVAAAAPNARAGSSNSGNVGGSQSGSNQFNASLQGSMNSVHSGDKKKTRNVTMV